MSETEIKPEWRGLNDWRYEREPFEARLALAWQKINELARGPSGSHASATDSLLNNGSITGPSCDKRDQIIVNTVIQWLGSPVGRGFVEEIMFSYELKMLLNGIRIVDPDELPSGLRQLRKNWLRHDLEKGL